VNEQAVRDPIILARLGELSFYEGKHAESEDLLNRALDITPNLPAVWWFKSRISGIQHRFDEAALFRRRAAFLGFRPVNPLDSQASVKVASLYGTDLASLRLLYPSCLKGADGTIILCIANEDVAGSRMQM
jgi:hypothetical protein